MLYLWVIFDAVLVLIFALSIKISMKKGFVKASSAVLSIVLTFVLMFLFQNTISTYLKNSDMGAAVKERVLFSLSDSTDKHSDISEDEFSKSSGIPDFLLKVVPDVSSKINDAKNEIAEQAAENIAASIINVLSIVILYVAIRLVLFVLIRFLDKIFRLPGLKTINKFLGALIGIVNALFIVYILCALLLWFVPTDSSETVKTAISQTYLTKYFYDNNLLLKLFL